jgi:hypothetical protein
MNVPKQLVETKDLLKDILTLFVEVDKSINSLKPPHDTDDFGKIETFVKILSSKGWMGAPWIVGSRGYLLNGTHRFNAMKKLGWKDEEIPTISIKDLCRMSGLDVGSLTNKGPIRKGFPAFDEIKSKLLPGIVKKYKL